MAACKLTRNAARCKRCKQTIESKHAGVVVYCGCRAISVDGGLTEVRRGGWLDFVEELSEPAPATEGQ